MWWTRGADDEGDDMAGADQEVHPATDPDPLGPLAAWVGTWRGGGHGDFPTIDAFDFVEEVVFSATGKPFLAYTQRTRHAVDDRPLHVESGYLRRVGEPAGDGAVAVEWVVAQPTGLAETAAGTLADDVLTTTAVPHRTPTAVEVREVRRRFVRAGDDLTYDLWMATADVPTTTHHLRASLHRA